MFLSLNKQEFDSAKHEFNQLVGYLKGLSEADGFPTIIKIANQLNNSESLTINSKVEFPSNLDCRRVKCSCGRTDCKVGLSFDDKVMLMTNKYGNETAMQLSKENIDEIISNLKQIKKEIK